MHRNVRCVGNEPTIGSKQCATEIKAFLKREKKKEKKREPGGGKARKESRSQKKKKKTNLVHAPHRKYP